MVYQKYLLSSHWKEFRAKALEYYGNKCADCGSKDKLEVHHETYERLGREELGDVIVLCHDCHEKWHRQFPKKKPRTTGGKRPYVKLMQDVKGIEDVSLDAAGLLLKLICGGNIEWQTGMVINKRTKKPLRSKMILKYMNIGDRKYKGIMAELRDRGLMVYRRSEGAYFISPNFIRKG